MCTTTVLYMAITTVLYVAITAVLYMAITKSCLCSTMRAYDVINVSPYGS